MNNENFSIKDLLRNLTNNQKLGIIAFLTITIIATIMIVGLVNTLQNNTSNKETEKNSGSTSSGIKWDDISNRNQEEIETVDVPVSTEYNEEHEYTLIDYLPSSKYGYKDYGDNQHGVRGYWIISENTAIEKGIVVSVDDCDVAGNTAAANEYLDNLPVDLSGYTVVYQTHVGDVPCNIP